MGKIRTYSSENTKEIVIASAKEETTIQKDPEIVYVQSEPIVVEKEIIVEVPVEKIVTEIKEVIVEVPVEVIVEKIVVQEKIVEKPVEVIVEKEKVVMDITQALAEKKRREEVEKINKKLKLALAVVAIASFVIGALCV